MCVKVKNVSWRCRRRFLNLINASARAMNAFNITNVKAAASAGVVAFSRENVLGLNRNFQSGNRHRPHKWIEQAQSCSSESNYYSMGHWVGNLSLCVRTCVCCENDTNSISSVTLTLALTNYSALQKVILSLQLSGRQLAFSRPRILSFSTMKRP